MSIIKHFLIFNFLILNFSHASICTSWGNPVKLGELDRIQVPEASGISISKQFPNRLYTHNDSGSITSFFSANLNGTSLKKYTFDNFKALDLEDMAIGPCFSSKTCLYFADIGDNLGIRPSIQIAILEEQESFSQSIHADHIINLKYPDFPHNAESVAVSNTGDIFILTKESIGAPKTAILFKVNSTVINQKLNSAVLEKVAELDIPYLNSSLPNLGKQATSMNISQDNSSFIVLNYFNAFEFNFDLNKGIHKKAHEMIRGQDYIPLQWVPLQQQEAITYSKNDYSIVYTTEARKLTVPIYEITCKNRIN